MDVTIHACLHLTRLETYATVQRLLYTQPKKNNDANIKHVWWSYFYEDEEGSIEYLRAMGDTPKKRALKLDEALAAGETQPILTILEIARMFTNNTLFSLLDSAGALMRRDKELLFPDDVFITSQLGVIFYSVSMKSRGTLWYDLFAAFQTLTDPVPIFNRLKTIAQHFPGCVLTIDLKEYIDKLQRNEQNNTYEAFLADRYCYGRFNLKQENIMMRFWFGHNGWLRFTREKEQCVELLREIGPDVEFRRREFERATRALYSASKFSSLVLLYEFVMGAEYIAALCRRAENNYKINEKRLVTESLRMHRRIFENEELFYALKFAFLTIPEPEILYDVLYNLIAPHVNTEDFFEPDELYCIARKKIKMQIEF